MSANRLSLAGLLLIGAVTTSCTVASSDTVGHGAVAHAAWAEACEDWADWDEPGPPFRIHGNTWYVGTCGISAILVTGDEGHILIDGGTERGAEPIAANIERLGFSLSDVKLLLHSHEHHDHVGGTARIKELTGAQLIASPRAAEVFATGLSATDDPQYGVADPFPPVKVDRILPDDGVVQLGSLTLTALPTPGHTPGALSWHWQSCDGQDCRRIVFADSLSAISDDTYRFSDYPAYVSAFREGIEKLARLDCDILLTPHPSASTMRDRLASPAGLIDRAGCANYATAVSARLDARLAEEDSK